MVPTTVGTFDRRFAFAVLCGMDWVCGSTWKAYVSNSVFFGCMSFGVITFGVISD
ncbi:hypothetical protein HPB47_002417, partial [Ixodes persulcatus]